MIDLHTHTIFSDGELVPAELARRAEEKGLVAIAITDHDDGSNIDFVVPKIVAIAEELNKHMKIRIIPGIEITHAPPSMIKPLAQKARKLGAKIILVHGETVAEPVASGTNRAAIEADIDILAHPGLITEEETIMAREKGILLEITARCGHSLTNGHVAKMAQKHGAKMALNTDSHAPGDLIDETFAKKVAFGAGLSEYDFEKIQKNAYENFCSR